MRRRKTASLLIGLMFICSISGYSTVICHGSDGHVSIEYVNHNHCECSDEHESSSEIQDTHPQIPDHLSFNHVHCNDIPIALNLYLTKSNTPDTLIAKALTFVYYKANTRYTNNILDISNISNSHNLPNFFIPLESIVILA